MTDCANPSCGRSFQPRWRKQKFCTPDCGYAVRRSPTVTLVCSNARCAKTFTRRESKTKNSKHGFQFCCRACKDFSQSLRGDCPEIRPSHYGTSLGREAYRQYISRLKTPRCCDCEEERRYLLMVHHIDGDHDNNVPSNWEIVCANCHVRRHLKRDSQGEWVFHPPSLTPREFLSGV